jgi:hypothetical protein
MFLEAAKAKIVQTPRGFSMDKLLLDLLKNAEVFFSFRRCWASNVASS